MSNCIDHLGDYSRRKRRMPILAIAIVVLSFSLPIQSKVVASDFEDDPEIASEATYMSDAEAARLLATAPPTGTQGPELIGFLRKQITAAQVLGKVAEQLRLLRQVVDESRRIGAKQQWHYVVEVMNAERGRGNYAEVERIRESLLAEPSVQTHQKAKLLFVEARWRASLGDTQGAMRLQARAREETSKILPYKIRPVSLQRLKADDPWTDAIILESRGRFDEAMSALRQAQVILSAEPELSKPQRRSNRGTGRRAGQSVDQALLLTDPESFRGQIMIARTQVRVDVTLALAESGQLNQAELRAREQLAALDRVGDDGPWRTRASIVLADVWLLQGSFDRALHQFDLLLRDGKHVHDASRSSTSLHVANQRGNALLGLQRWGDAVDQFDAIERITRDDAAASELVGNKVNRGLAFLMFGSSQRAWTILDSAYSGLSLRLGPEHPLTVEARGIRAMALFGIGRSDEAFAELQAVTESFADHIEYSDLQEHGLSQLRRRLIVEAWLEMLAQRYPLSRDDDERQQIAEQGLRGAEYLRLRRTQDAISASAARASASSTELAALVREEQDQQQESDALYRALFRSLELPLGDTPDPADAEIRRRVGSLEGKHRALVARLTARFPAYARLAHPRPPRVAELARALERDEVYLAVQPTPKMTLTWAVNSNGRVYMSVSGLSASDVTTMVEVLRNAVKVTGTSLAGLPPFDVATAYALYQALLAPVAPAWSSGSRLVVSADGALGHLPFALLVDSPIDWPSQDKSSSNQTKVVNNFEDYKFVPWLVRSHSLAYVPSAAALLSLRAATRSGPAGQAFFGVGDPDFGGIANLGSTGRRVAISRGADGIVGAPDNSAQRGPGALTFWSRYALLPPLPETRDEILAIATALGADPRADTLLGAAATRAGVRTSPLANRRVIAFATHGLVPGDLPLLDEPALALAAGPLPSGHERVSAGSTLTQGDGLAAGHVDFAQDWPKDLPLLTLTDVLGLKLNADWVILSACNTASADGRSADAISGLGRAFFYAGARALLVTHWEVESESARDLVADTVSHYARDGSERAEALRRAQLNLIDHGGNAAVGISYAHPLFWAPYAVVGDGGR